MEEVENSGQRNGPCAIANCEELGRAIGKFGSIELIYCPKHRKYGQEVINTFLEDILNYRKSELHDLAKQELIFGGEKILDEENEKKLGSWIKKETFQRYLRGIGSAEITITEFAIERKEEPGEKPKVVGDTIQPTEGELRDDAKESGSIREILLIDKPGQTIIVENIRK